MTKSVEQVRREWQEKYGHMTPDEIREDTRERIGRILAKPPIFDMTADELMKLTREDG